MGGGRSRLRSRVHCNARPVGWFLEPTRNFSRPGVPKPIRQSCSKISAGRQFHDAQEGWHGLGAWHVEVNYRHARGKNLGQIFGRRQQVSNPALLRRREFIGLLGAAAACPCIAPAQSLQAVIGLVSIGASPTDPANFRPFLQQMGELGYADGRNIKFERRFAAGNDSLTKGFLADLVRRQVDDYRRHWHTRDHCRQRDNLTELLYKLACTAPKL